MRVEITCSDPSVAFAGEWPRAESAGEILAQYRERSRALGVPIQIAIQRRGVWCIAPNGKVIAGSLFDLEKLQDQNTAKGRARRRKA